MDRFKTMETLVEIVKAGSFAEAARKLGRSRAVVSKHVQQLEQHLHAQLFNRTTRQLSLTEVGEEYYAFARNVLESLKDEDEVVAQLQHETRGTLKVLAPASFGNEVLGPIVVDFITRYPDIKVSMVFNSTFGSVDFVDSGYDLAICLSTALDDSSFIGRRVGEIAWIACASRKYLAQHGRPSVPDDLLQHNCLVTRGRSNGPLWKFEGQEGSVSVRVSGSLVANATVTREAAVAGVGIALLPSYSVTAALASGALERILPAYNTEKRQIYAVYPSGRYLPNKIKAFISFLGNQVGDGDPTPESRKRPRRHGVSVT